MWMSHPGEKCQENFLKQPVKGATKPDTRSGQRRQKKTIAIKSTRPIISSPLTFDVTLSRKVLDVLCGSLQQREPRTDAVLRIRAVVRLLLKLSKSGRLHEDFRWIEIAESYGWEPILFKSRILLDLYIGVFNAYSHRIGLATSSAAFSFVFDELAAVVQDFNSGNYTPDSSYSAIFGVLDAHLKGDTVIEDLSNDPIASGLGPIGFPPELFKTTFSMTAHLNPETNEPAISGTPGTVFINVDLIDFNWRSCGRFGLYFYVMFLTALEAAEVPTKVNEGLFLGSWEMVKERVEHADRIYAAARFGGRDHGRMASIDLQWYRAILTSDNLDAMNETVIDIEGDLWYLHFHRWRNGPAPPQYEKTRAFADEIFGLLVQLLGHEVREMRARAVTLLNVFLDQHEWQAYFPLITLTKSIGEELSITFSLDLEEGADEGEPPKGVTLQLSSPCHMYDNRCNASFSEYHQVDKWTIVTDELRPGQRKKRWQGVVSLGKLRRAGFYDWRVVKSEASLGSWEVCLQSCPEFRRLWGNSNWENDGDVGSNWNPVLRILNGEGGWSTSVPIQGRVICQPYGVLSGGMLEVDLGEANEGVSLIRQRLQSYVDRGIGVLSVKGVRSRVGAVDGMRNLFRGMPGVEPPTEQAYCRRITSDRAPPVIDYSLGTSLQSINSQVGREGISLVVEASLRVSSVNCSRKYDDLGLEVIEERTGRKVPLFGAPGAAELSERESRVLNWRDLRNWRLFSNELVEWLDIGMARGFVIEEFDWAPLIMQRDHEELSRMDPDGQPHYTENEMLMAKVVKPFVSQSYRSSMISWPDPFAVYVCKKLWAASPEAVIIAEVADPTLSSLLCRSGVVPKVISTLTVAAAVLGVCSPDKSGTVAACALVRDLQYRPPAEMSVRILQDFLSSFLKSRPSGAPAMLSLGSQTASCPLEVLGGYAWPFALLLHFIPGQTALSEGDESAELPKIVYKNPMLPQDTEESAASDDDVGPLATPTARASSFIREVRRKTSSPHLRSLQSPSRTRLLEGQIDLTRLTPRNASQKSLNAGSMSSSHIKMLKFGVNGSSPREVQVEEELAAIGESRRSWEQHLEICSFLSTKIDETLGGNSSEHLYIPLEVIGSGEANSEVITATRVVRDGHFIVMAVNFGRESRYVQVSFANMIKLMRNCGFDRKSHYLISDFDDQGISAPSDICSFSECIQMSLELDVPAGGYHAKVFRMRDASEQISRHDLYGYAMNRLENVRRQIISVHDPSLKKQLAKCISSNAVVVDLIDSLQQPNKPVFFGRFMSDLAGVLEDMYGSEKGSYHRFQSMIWDLGIFRPSSTLVLPEELRATGEKSLAPVWAEQVNKLASAILPSVAEHPELQAPANLATYLSENSGLGPIVFVTAEHSKYSSIGGLGVMVDDLTATLAGFLGQEVWVIAPYYDYDQKGVKNDFGADGVTYRGNLECKVGSESVVFGLHYILHRGVNTFMVHQPALFPCAYPDRQGIEQIRFLSFIAKSFLEVICHNISLGMRMPEVIVSNDWHTGLVPAYGKCKFGDLFQGCTFFHIVHNLDASYEGRLWCDQDPQEIHGLPREYLVDPAWRQVVYNPSRCGLLASDAWGTVSWSYKNELLGITGNGSPLKSILSRQPDAFAFPNGIPIETREALIIDKLKAGGLIAADYVVTKEDQWLDLHDVSKAYIQRKYFGFETPDLTIPLFAFVGRITSQKGVHLIVQSAEALIHRYNQRVQFLIGGLVNWKDSYAAICGHGMKALRDRFPSSFWCGPDDFFKDGPLCNSGADFSMMPSAFEPGGIVQHEFFVAGTPVVAFKTGGLKDTVHEFNPETNEGAGFTFESYNSGDYLFACDRALRTFADKTKYTILRRNARKACISSQTVAAEWLGEFAKLRQKYSVMVCTKAPSQNSVPLNVSELVNLLKKDDDVIKMNKLSTEVVPETPRVFSDVMRAKMTTARIRWKPESDRPKPRNVAVSGCWNEWQVRHPMFWDPSTEQYVVTFTVPRGKWTYKVIRDGEWVLNQGAAEQESDDRGNINSVLRC